MDEAIAEDQEELERLQRQEMESASLEDYLDGADGALGAGDNAVEEDHEYAEDEASPVAALGDPVHPAAAAGPSRPANRSDETDFTGPWQEHMGQFRKAPSEPEDASKRSRKKPRHNGHIVPGSEDGDDVVQRIASGRPGPPSVASSNDLFGDDGSEDLGNAAAAANGQVTYVDARSMGDYIPTHFGYYVTAKIPEFRHGSSTNSTWMSYADAKDEVEFMTPVRALCWNIPAELFSFDSTRFRHWTTPDKNSIRANNIASVVSFCFTGTSKGFLSGQHEELQRASGEADEDSEQSEKDKNNNKPSRVHRYAFMLPTDNNVTLPMFTIAYEELYNRELTKVTAIRIWKFVFDKAHSDSELCRKLLDENRDTMANAGVAHAPNVSRRKSLVAEQKQNRQQMGGLKGASALEYYAGMQYAGIKDEEVWYRRLVSYGGKNMHNDGRPFLDDTRLPKGVNNKRIQKDQVLGGTHPYSPEYVFNARREKGFAAGTVSLETNEPLDIHPDFLDTSKYWTDRNEFMLPQVSQRNEGFFFLVNPYVTNIFDAPLPRPIYGTASAGPHILKLYRECFYDQVQAAGGTNASLSDCFNSMMTKQDPAALEMEKQMSETVISYDSIDATDLERKGLRHYGEVDASNNFIIEPRQVMKKIAQETRRVHAELLQPWLKQREALRTAKNAEIKKAERERAESLEESERMDIDYHDDRMGELREIENDTTARHCEVTRDLVMLHLSRIQDAFRSKIERETIPQGWIAMYDGLYEELAGMPEGTASVAFAFKWDLRFDDISSFTHINSWLGQFFENECFIEGRDRRIMDELFLHCFEQYGDVTFLLLLCGYKGNGKTLRTERAMAVFPKNWITAGGPASAKSGMNGQSDSTNGKNVIYDEMVDELCESDGSDRLEFWKQIVLKREYTYNRTVSVVNTDGSESHQTMKLRTPHDETHCICTNYGMAFTKNGDPTDTKFAMIDRSIAHLVRSIGKNAHTDSEFNDHMSKSEQQDKLKMFRIFVCLVGATKLAIKSVPAFQPSLALANKIFDYLDNEMIVGEYNLPRRSPRKSLKREENLRTMCIMKAVADVFLYRQTAVEFESGCLGPDGNPQPFKFTMLYDVIRQLRATPELIFMAWSQSLDYNIGTAAHSFAAMTALCEKFQLTIGDWFKKPSTTDLDEVRRASVQSPSIEQPVQPVQPVRAQCGSDREHEQAIRDHEEAIKTWQMTQEDRSVQEKMVQLPQIFGPQGVSRADRQLMLRGFERQRRATSLYRHTCTLNGNSDLQMDQPIATIEKIMEKHGSPPDVNEDGSSSAFSSSDYMPLYSSAIMANTVQVCCLYNYQSVVNWCSGRESNYNVIGNSMIGTSNEVNYSEKTSRGPCQWNTAWLRMDAQDGWKKLAQDTIHNNKTCKIFDLPHMCLRDMFYLLSTRDNARRCTEEPKLPPPMKKSSAFVTLEGKPIPEMFTGSIRMRGITDSRGQTFPPGHEGKSRHPYSCVNDMPLQRSIDFASNHGRLPGMMPIVSNNVRDAPPVRLVGDGDKRYVELNTAAALAHTKMLAEASFRCSLHPGMENIQEAFCESSHGPDGLCYSVLNDVPVDPDSDQCTRFAYSYDMLTISFTLDAMGRYYNPEINEYCQMYTDAFGDTLGFKPTVKDMPHMSMRFVGFEDSKSRRLLSVPPRKERSPAFRAIEVGDAADNADDYHTTHTHLQLSLGHEPSDEEIERYLKSKAGARAMSGVTGDLMSTTTYFSHTLTTLKERGMVSGEDDVVLHLVADDPYGFRLRVAEAAGRKINALINGCDEIKRAHRYNPPGYEKLTPEKLLRARDVEVHRVRTKLYTNMELPEDLEPLRKYAPLDIGELAKMTYHKRNEDRERLEAVERERKKKRFSGVDSSSQFKNMSRFRVLTLPGKGKDPMRSPGSGGIRARGRRDARMDARMDASAAGASGSRDA